MPAGPLTLLTGKVLKDKVRLSIASLVRNFETPQRRPTITMTTINPYSTLRPGTVDLAAVSMRRAANNVRALQQGVDIPYMGTLIATKSVAMDGIRVLAKEKNSLLAVDTTIARQGVRHLNNLLAGAGVAATERNLENAFIHFDTAAQRLTSLLKDLTTKAHTTSIIRG